MAKISKAESKALTLEEIEFASKISYSVRHKLSPEETAKIMSIACTIFWRAMCEEGGSNVEVSKKASQKLSYMFKCNSKLDTRGTPRQDFVENVVEEACDNIQNDRFVLQSLKVLKKVLEHYDNNRSEVMEKQMRKDIVTALQGNLKRFKMKIKERMQTQEDNENQQINEDYLNKLLDDKKFTFNQHISKRQHFISFLLMNVEHSTNQIKHIMGMMWDELVINSFTEIEGDLFRKWFTDFTDKINKSLESQNILGEFFNEKIVYVRTQEKSQKNFGILKTFFELFYKLNQVQGRLDEVVVKLENNYYQNFLNDQNTEEKYYKLKVSPHELEGIEAFWRLILEVDSEPLAQELINFLVPLYIRPAVNTNTKLTQFRVYQKEFVEKCQILLFECFQNPTSTPEVQKHTKRLFLLLQSLVDESEASGITGPPSVSCLYRGDQINITLENKIYVYYDNNKTIEQKIFGNMTIYELKKYVANEIKRVSWDQLRLTRKYLNEEIKDNQNGKNLRDIKIKLGERIIITQKPSPTIEAEAQTFKDDNLNPKALKAFKEVFEMFSTSGIMAKEDAANFIRCCLNDKCHAEDQRVKDLFEKYDTDKDDILKEEDFIKFYYDSSMRKPAVVWANLKALNYREDLTKYTDDSGIEIEEEDLARNIIVKSKSQFNLIFANLARNDEIGSQAWLLASRLPPYPDCYAKLIKFEGQTNENGEFDWESLIESSSIFKMIYYLYIIEYLMEEGDEGGQDSLLAMAGIENVKDFKRNWRSDFVRYGGFNHLVTQMMSTQEKGWSKADCMLLYSFIQKILKNYIMAACSQTSSDVYKSISFMKYTHIPYSLLVSLNEKELEEENATNMKVKKDEKEEQLKKEENNDIPLCKCESDEKWEKGETSPRTMGPIGPFLPDDPRSNHTAQSAKEYRKQQDDRANSKENRNKSLLEEKEDFIQFRDSLKKENAENLMNKIEAISTIKFVVNLIEHLLQKEGMQEAEERSIIEHSQSVIVCLCIHKPQILNLLLDTNNENLLDENSKLRIKGYPDFVSLMMAGLSYQEIFTVRKQFNNCYLVIIRETKSKDLQKYLLKVLQENIQNDENSLSTKGAFRFIELACTLLEDFCSSRVDPKKLITKKDINDIINQDTLFYKVLDMLMKQSSDSRQLSEQFDADKLIIGYFNLLERIIDIEPGWDPRLHISIIFIYK